MPITNYEAQIQSSKLHPPPFDPLQPSIPISYPIKTLEKLATRAYLESFRYPFNKSFAPLRSYTLANWPIILVCHDKWIQGGKNENIYAIWHWYLIDLLVYFARYLVTLPPPWTIAAHRHGLPGRGHHGFVEGEQLSNSPRNNPKSYSIEVSMDFKEASFRDGINIAFKGILQSNKGFSTRMFKGNLLLDEMPLYITYCVRANEGSPLSVSFHFSSPSNETTSILIVPSKTNESSKKFDKVIVPRSVNKPPGWIIEEGTIEMNGFTLIGIRAVRFRPMLENGKVRQDHIRIENSEGGNSGFPSPSSWLIEAQNIKWSLGSHGSKLVSAKLTWKLKDGSKFEFSKYIVYVEKNSKNDARNSGSLKRIREYIGATYVEAFYVTDISIPSTTCTLKFVIQACTVDGICQKLDDSPFFQLNVKDQ
ncbi:cytosolic endo-beta-N-acetylglucosaminidase 1-like [Euphorbia lathyris]|uniref:cytosolic endo-beta-N-acetylglucosaminidase 1-like n=1 Tax=Euphorbia lathyris TaxID=212925 RepID=UPI0033139BD5